MPLYYLGQAIYIANYFVCEVLIIKLIYQKTVHI